MPLTGNDHRMEDSNQLPQTVFAAGVVPGLGEWDCNFNGVTPETEETPDD